MGRRNLLSQFLYSLDQNFTEGVDHHSYRIEHNYKMDNKIFGYTSLNNLRDFSRNFTGFLKENYNDIKQIGDIKAEHLQAFLNNKNEQGCSQTTLNAYKSNFNKIEEVVNSTFKSVNWDYKDVVITPSSVKQYDSSRGANSVISKEDVQTLKEYFQENRSISGDAILCQCELGIRVEELVQIKMFNLDLDNNKINLTNTKGGKLQTKDISPVIKQIIEDNIIGKFNANDKVFDINSSSINKQLSRVQDKLGLEKHSNHDIRRRLAQDFYDKCRNNGDSPETALAKTSLFLNHVTPRQKMMTKSYIVIW